MSGVVLNTEQDEDNSNFIFLLGDGISDWTSNPSALYFSGFTHTHDISFIKSLIVYFKVNGVHCGRKGNHSLRKPSLCRDCNIPSSIAGDTYFVCQFTKESDITVKSHEELNKFSRYGIKNSFHDIPFEVFPYNVHEIHHHKFSTTSN